MACNHCDEAPCLNSCPALAYSKDENSNTIVFHEDKCIGCTYCTWACPYDASKFVNSNGLVEKCTLCTNRLNEGLQPACKNLCPTGALHFDKFEPVIQDKIPGFTEKEIGAGIKVVPLRSKKSPLKNTKLSKEENSNYERIQLKQSSKISIKKEWVLILFSLLTAILTAFVSKSVVDGELTNKWIFLGAGIIGMVLSSIHLGKKFRAWRSVLNLKSSWLSREILSYSLFIVLTFIWLDTIRLEIGYIAALLGFMTCFAIDKVYYVTNKVTRLNMHSASIFLTAMFLTAILIENYLLVYTVLVLKLLLYIYRKIYFRIQSKSINPIISLFRIVLGLLIPFIILIVEFNFKSEMIVGLVLIGEIIDRVEFYLELDISTPKNQIMEDLKEMLSIVKN